MATIAVQVGEAPEVEAFLAQRIYEYNASATGYDNAESFTALSDEGGTVEAGVCGYTWGGCCYVSYLWVVESSRHKGLGSDLLAAVERHAREKGCTQVLLWTHSFQAPEFYARRGYQLTARIADHPIGYSSGVYVKRLSVARV
jgi:GNAT superfamily N-acetyltransferase